MNIKRRVSISSIWISAMLLLLTTSASAQQATKPRPVQTMQGAQSLVASQAALITEFEVNGMKVLVKRREGSLTVGAGLFIKGGSRNITAENAGIEGLTLETSTEASASFPRARMRDELARMGSVIGASSNQDYSVLSLRTTRLHFDRSWQLFTDVALNPAFTKEDFALIQQRLLSSLRDDNDNPESHLQHLHDRLAYAGHPYMNPMRGTAETVARLTVEDVRNYHRKIMQTSQLLLVIVGDVDPNKLRAMVTASFNKLPRGTYKTEPLPQLVFDKSVVEITPRALETNYIQGYFTAPAPNSPDIHPMRIASSLLRDRVFQEVRAKRNLSYAPDAFLRTQGANIGGIYVTSDDTNQSVRLMLEEINRLQQVPISKEDIQAVVAQYLTSYYIAQETNVAQAGELAQYELLGGGWRSSLDIIDRLSAVTPEDVQRVSQKYMRNLRFVVLGDPKSVDVKVFTGRSD
ncbi:MAG TPA: pitrilysin family protein [Pyrinomonadaceae bacterium]